MLKNSTENQSQRWKQKYFENLDKTEAQEKKLLSRIRLLTDGLADVCSYGDELTPRLSREWSTLRRAARKSGDDRSLDQPIRSLTTALQAQAEAVRSARHNTSVALIDAIDQLLSIDPPADCRRNLRKLKRTVQGKTLDEIELAAQIGRYTEQLRHTLDQCHNTGTTVPATSGARHLNIAATQLEETQLLPDTVGTAPQQPVMPAANDTATGNDARQIGDALQYFLEQLDIPKPLSNGATQLQRRLQQELSWTDLDDVLMPCIELSLASLEWHYSQFGDFLEQINSQLDAVQNFLQASHESRNTQNNNQQQLNQSVVQIVTDIEQAVTGSDTLSNLKQAISGKMHNIVGALKQYEEAEQAREAELMYEVELLGGKLQQLESQSQTMRIKLESQKELARRDNVTRLPNRAAYDEHIQFEYKRWKRYGLPFSLILGDIDHFKHFNDNYGHLAGDKVLKQVADILKTRLRETDFVARYGGEEFVVLLPNTAKSEAEIVAEKLRQGVAALELSSRHETSKITMSFGISQLIKTDSVETLFERTDQALYTAKNHGRNRCCSA